MMDVSFNGVDITCIAPFDLLNVAVGTPEVIPVTVRPAIASKTVFIRRELGPRPILISGDLKEPDMIRRQEWVAALMAWASSERPAALVVPQEGRGYFLAECSAFPDTTARDWWEDMEIGFTAYDPCYRGHVEHMAAIPGNVQVNGSESPLLRIEQAITATLQAPTWAAAGQVLTLAGSVPPGTLVVDFEREEVTLDGVSIQYQVTLSSHFWSLQPGLNAITCSNGAGGTLYWRERWL